MLNTDIKYDYFRSYPVSLDRSTWTNCAPSCPSWRRKAEPSCLPRASTADAVEMQYSADMRYLDQIYEVTVPLPDPNLPDADFVAELTSNFHRRYEELYSYSQQSQEVRLVTLRSAAVGKLPRIAQLVGAKAGGQAKPVGNRRIYLDGWREAPTYAADGLPAGAEIAGPAIIESEFTTISCGRATTPRWMPWAASSCA